MTIPTKSTLPSVIAPPAIAPPAIAPPAIAPPAIAPPAIVSSIAPPIEQLIALFSQHLPDVEFPNVNASNLAELGCKVSASHTALVELERQLHDAHEVYSSAKHTLLEKSKTALGYAKVYAADDEELLSALSAIHIVKKTRVDPAKRKSRRTNRTKKSEQASLPLPDDVAGNVVSLNS